MCCKLGHDDCGVREMAKTKEVWDYTYPDCPKLELWHKYLVKQKIQGKEEEYRAVLSSIDKRGKKGSEFNFRAANAGYDFCDMDRNKAHFVIYANYGITWWIEKELPQSETGEYDVTKGRRFDD